MDRRTIRTKGLLWEAFVTLVSEKGYDQVSIREIIDMAGVGKSTFYAHYENKEHLLRSGQVHLLPSLLKKENSTGFPDFKPLLKHGKENYHLAKALLLNGNEGIITEHIENFVNQKLCDFMIGGKKPFSMVLKIKQQLVLKATASAVASLLINWMLTDVVVPIMEMEQLIENQVRSSGSVL